MNIGFIWRWTKPDAEYMASREKEITEYLQGYTTNLCCPSGNIIVYLGENMLSKTRRFDGLISCRECGKELMTCKADNFAYNLNFTMLE